MEPFKHLLIGFVGVSIGLMLMAFTIREKKPIKIVETKEVILQPVEERFSDLKLLKYLKELNIKFYDIVYAQAVLETGHFKSDSFKNGNNLFGMKVAKQRPTTAIAEYLGHAKYTSWKESVMDYALYQSKYLSKIDSKEEYFSYLEKNYAEDPGYIKKIKSIVASIN
jgi:uncharacterized FlgJ-related protein